MRVLLALVLFGLLASAAHARPQLPQPIPPVPGNPADRLLDVPIEDFAYTERGRKRRRVDRTTAHEDHIHIGMSKAGAQARTSFWAGR